MGSAATADAPGAAGLYGLEALAENVQITKANKTRFYVLSKERIAGGTNGDELVRFASACAGVAVSRYPMQLDPPELREIEELIIRDIAE